MNRDRESMSLEARVTIGLIAFSTVLYGCSEANNHKGLPTVNSDNQPKPTRTSTADLDGQPQTEETADPMKDITILMHPEEPNFCDKGSYPCMNQRGPLCCDVDTETNR